MSIPVIFPKGALKIDVLRYSDNGESTQSLCFMDSKFFCHGLEDEAREVKVAGEMCIPTGLYEIVYREVDSPLTLNYRKKFPWFTYHLEIKDVLNFKYVYVHIGNTEKNTDACYLVGDTTRNNQVVSGFVGKSVKAYKRFYQKVGPYLDHGKRVFIQFDDMSEDFNKAVPKSWRGNK